MSKERKKAKLFTQTVPEVTPDETRTDLPDPASVSYYASIIPCF